MKRREFLAAAVAAGSAWWVPYGVSCGVSSVTPEVARLGSARGPRSSEDDNLLILVELKGGNDGLNSVVPFSDPLYRASRPNLALRRDAVIALDEHTALHPSLVPLLPLWRARQLAIVQGVGYEQANLSHFRSSEIWDTASGADHYLHDGWLARAFAQRGARAGFGAHGIVLGSAEQGPLASGARAAGLSPAQGPTALKTAFPSGAFGASIETAMAMLAASPHPLRSPPSAGQRIAAIRMTLNGFDTHDNQPRRHAALLAQFAAGMVAMHDALVELGRWNSTLIVTYAEFGRRVSENDSLGTEHGSAAAHFVAGGRVRGGLYGDAPRLARVDGSGNLPVGVDFRRIYATVLRSWWSLDPQTVLGRRFEPLPLLRV